MQKPSQTRIALSLGNFSVPATMHELEDAPQIDAFKIPSLLTAVTQCSFHFFNIIVPLEFSLSLKNSFSPPYEVRESVQDVSEAFRDEKDR